MKLFEADEFDERIQAVENRSGRIAWEVLSSLLIMGGVLYSRIAEERTDLLLLVIIPLFISMIVAAIVRSRSGVSGNELEYERERLKRSSAAGRLFRRQYTIQTVWGNLIILGLIPWADWSIVWILVFLGLVVVGNVIGFFMMKKEYPGLQKSKPMEGGR